jgi:hypothetical protein
MVDQAPSQYYDFDAEWEADQAEPLAIKVKGKFYQLQPELPARAILLAVQMQKKGVRNIKVDELLDVIGMLTGGRENAEQMMADGIGLSQLYGVMNKTMKLVREGLPAEVQAQADAAQGEAPAPALPGAFTSSTAS